MFACLQKIKNEDFIIVEIIFFGKPLAMHY